MNRNAENGRGVMMRREAAAAVGPPDERYFMHCEGLDWCMRVSQQGWRILFVPDAKVIHIKGVSSRHRSLAAGYHKHRGMIQFLPKVLARDVSALADGSSNRGHLG